MDVDSTSWLITRLRAAVETQPSVDDHQVSALLAELPPDDDLTERARCLRVDAAAALVARSVHEPTPVAESSDFDERKRHVLARLEGHLDRYLTAFASGNMDAPSRSVSRELPTARPGEYSRLVTNLAMPLARGILERALRPAVAPDALATAAPAVRKTVDELVARIDRLARDADGFDPRAAFADPAGTITTAVDVLLDPSEEAQHLEYATVTYLWLAARLLDQSLALVTERAADLAARRLATAAMFAPLGFEARTAIKALVDALASLSDPNLVTSGALTFVANELTERASDFIVLLTESRTA